jgi:hypothetical protein
MPGRDLLPDGATVLREVFLDERGEPCAPEAAAQIEVEVRYIDGSTERTYLQR